MVDILDIQLNRAKSGLGNRFSLRGRRSSRQQYDISTLEGIKSFAEERGIPVKEKKSFFGVLGKLSDILSTGGYAVGGIISGEGVIGGIRKKILPSDAIGISKLQPKTAIGKVGKFVASLGADILLDPTTYLTFGAGAGVKVTTKTGEKVLSKYGAKVLGEMSEKKAYEISGLLKSKGINRPVEQIKSDLISKTLSSSNFTDSILGKAVKDKNIFDEGGIKFAGMSLVQGKTIMKPAKGVFDFMVSGMEKTEAGKEFVKGIRSVKNSVGMMFQRDYGLPKKVVKLKQSLLDSLDYETNKAIASSVDLYKGTTKKERELIAEAIDSNNYDNLLPHLISPMNRTKLEFEKIAKIEMKMGILNKTRDDYVTHLYKGDKDKIKNILTKYKNSQLNLGKNKFAQQRDIPTIEEARALGLEPETDIAKILTVRKVASQKAILEKKYVDKLKSLFTKDKIEQLSPEFVKEFGDVFQEVKLPGRFKKIKEDGVTKSVRVSQKLKLPVAVAKDLINFRKKAIDDEATNFALRNFDKVQNYYKRFLTLPFPAFHARNFISSVSQNFLDINIQSLNPEKHLQVINILNGKKGSLVDSFGRKYTFKKILEEAQKNGVITESFFELDIQKNIEQKLSNALRRISINSFNPLSTKNFVFKTGEKTGRYIENEARMVNFITNLQRGFSFEEASVRTKQFLFDYNNLSKFEKEFLRRMIPFYTFTRKNLELQVKALLKTPGLIGAELKLAKPVSELLNNAANSLSEEEKELLPDWIKGQLNFVIDRDTEGSKILYGTGLPIEDAVKFIKPPDMLMKEIINRGSFIPKFFIERALGIDSFRAEDIDDLNQAYDIRGLDNKIGLPEWFKVLVDYREVEGSDGIFRPVANPDWLHIMRSLPTSRWQNLVGKLDDDRKSDGQKMFDLITGLKIHTVDFEKQAVKIEREQIKEIEDRLIQMGELRRFEKAYIPSQ